MTDGSIAQDSRHVKSEGDPLAGTDYDRLPELPAVVLPVCCSCRATTDLESVHWAQRGVSGSYSQCRDLAACLARVRERLKAPTQPEHLSGLLRPHVGRRAGRNRRAS